MRRLFQIAILAAGLDYISKMLILNVVQLPLVGRIEVFPPFLNFSHGVELRGEFWAICP